jgi:hypothetical protein
MKVRSQGWCHSVLQIPSHKKVISAALACRFVGFVWLISTVGPEQYEQDEWPCPTVTTEMGLDIGPGEILISEKWKRETLAAVPPLPGNARSRANYTSAGECPFICPYLLFLWLRQRCTQTRIKLARAPPYQRRIIIQRETLSSNA